MLVIGPAVHHPAGLMGNAAAHLVSPSLAPVRKPIGRRRGQSCLRTSAGCQVIVLITSDTRTGGQGAGDNPSTISILFKAGVGNVLVRCIFYFRDGIGSIVTPDITSPVVAGLCLLQQVALRIVVAKAHSGFQRARTILYLNILRLYDVLCTIPDLIFGSHGLDTVLIAEGFCLQPG